MANRGYYEHSGEFSLPGVALSLAVGLPAGALLAAAYAYLALYIPLAGVITFILTAGFGALVGLATGFGLVAGRVRNRAIAFAVAGATALGAFYVSWVVWSYALLHRAEVEEVSLLAMLLAPQALWTLIEGINQAGAWSISNVTPTGGVLWGIWALEAALILGPAVTLALAAISSPFCERCSAWTTATSGVALVASGDADSLKSRVEAKDFASLERLGPLASDATEWFRFDLNSCETCGELHTLDVKHVTVKVDGKENTSESTQDVLQHLLLSSSEAEAVRGLQARLRKPPTAA